MSESGGPGAGLHGVVGGVREHEGPLGAQHPALDDCAQASARRETDWENQAIQTATMIFSGIRCRVGW